MTPQQEYTESTNVARGFLIAIPVSLALWGVLYVLLAALSAVA